MCSPRGIQSLRLNNVNGFGDFDFALNDGVGATADDIIEPGENVEFILDITGAGTIDMTDFDVLNLAGFSHAAKFVNGPDDPESPGNEDSGFGAVPEPGTALARYRSDQHSSRGAR